MCVRSASNSPSPAAKRLLPVVLRDKALKRERGRDHGEEEEEEAMRYKMMSLDHVVKE